MVLYRRAVKAIADIKQHFRSCKEEKTMTLAGSRNPLRSGRSYLYACVGIVALAAVLSSIAPQPVIGQSPKPAQDVRVINTPLAVTVNEGEINAEVTGELSAKQSGAWNVGINPQANAVTVDNPASNPVRTSQGLRPFGKALFFTIPGTSIINGGSFTVPAGKVLVIDYISLTYNNFDGSTWPYELTVATKVGGETVRARFPLSFTNDLKPDHFSEAVKLYADPGTTVNIQARRHDMPHLDVDLEVYIHGHLEDAIDA
jgi:hypothetical protein